MSFADITLLVAAATTGLSAGIFLAFTTLIIPGLRDAPTPVMLAGFQTIDRRLQPNSPSISWQPLFGVIVFGSAPLCLLALIANWSILDGGMLWLVAAATIITGVGFWGTTLGKIVPLNNRIRDMKIEDMSSAELASARTEFEHIWGRWNLARTAILILGFILILIPLGAG